MRTRGEPNRTSIVMRCEPIHDLVLSRAGIIRDASESLTLSEQMRDAKKNQCELNRSPIEPKMPLETACIQKALGTPPKLNRHITNALRCKAVSGLESTTQ
eukprot:1994216-Alexandrium_andersonii.AAC.1